MRSMPTRAEAQNCQFVTWKDPNKYFFRNGRPRQPANHRQAIIEKDRSNASTLPVPFLKSGPDFHRNSLSRAALDGTVPGRVSNRVPILKLSALLVVYAT